MKSFIARFVIFYLTIGFAASLASMNATFVRLYALIFGMLPGH
jgi:hypothetical protein